MKLQPKDLRIENIVTVNNSKAHPKLKDIPLRITGVRENSNGYVVNLEHINKIPNTYCESYCQLIEFIEPIPLTEELLLKCGAKVIENNEKYADYKLDFVRIRIVKSENIFFTWMSDALVHIRFIHTLQNILFLKGKELEINL